MLVPCLLTSAFDITASCPRLRPSEPRPSPTKELPPLCCCEFCSFEPGKAWALEEAAGEQPDACGPPEVAIQVLQGTLRACHHTRLTLVVKTSQLADHLASGWCGVATQEYAHNHNTAQRHASARGACPALVVGGSWGCFSAKTPGYCGFSMCMCLTILMSLFALLFREAGRH